MERFMIAPRRDTPKPRFTIATLLWVMLIVAIFGAAGVAAELLWGMAWLAVAPALLLVVVLLQYPLMRSVGRDLGKKAAHDHEP